MDMLSGFLWPWMSQRKYRKSKDLISSKLSEKLISFTDSNSITIANGRTKGDTHGSFTFISERGSSVLDYFMYTHGLTQIISDMWIEELSYSDRLPIVLQINTGYEAIKSSYKNEILTRKFIWTKENVEMLKHNLSDIEVGNETDINTETVNFTKQIYTAMESANIIKFAKRRHQLSKPWYDKDCYIMKKTTKVSLQRCRNSNNIHDRQKYIEARREYFKLLQRKRDEFNKDKNERIKNAKDPKSFWNAIASFRKKPIIQGEIDIKEWFLFYKNLLNKENKEATFTLNQMIGWKDPDLDAEITLEEIHDVVKKLANGKAVGRDGIPNELLNNLPIPTLTKLKNLFNKIMSTEKYPQLWTNSKVHPIYKSGDKNNPTNYRGIALCSNISKLFTTILRNRLNNWIEKREIILENQAGFRKNRSCTDHIILLNSLIQLSLRRKRGKLYVFFVDLTKAFDTVPHDLLWQKLHKMGISNKFVMLIKNFYQEAKITIRWKGQYSSNVKINSGVLQGESLSPLLFILYMADLIELYNNSALTGFHLPDFGVLHLLMYADDIAIIGDSKINLQIKINLLKSYLDKNKLVLNENKSKIMVFRNGGRPARHENWYWGDTPLTVASNITYLGYPFTSTINSKKIRKVGQLNCSTFKRRLGIKFHSWKREEQGHNKKSPCLPYLNCKYSIFTCSLMVNIVCNSTENPYRARCPNKAVLLLLLLDESTDVSNTAQVLIYIRGVDKSYEVHEELLDMYSIHGTTTGTDIFKGVEMAINKKNLRWKNLKCITTDGGKNMSGKDKGVVALVSKAVENDGGSKPLVLHCIIHQQSLCGKCLDMSDVLKPVISTVNFIRSFGLNHRKFRQFIAEIGEADLPYHTAVRWLSCGKVLQRFFELRAVIEIFLNEKHRPLTELQNNAWLWKLAFYVDLTKHVNELNLRLQGENQHLPDLYTNIKSFRMKLILFQSQLRSKCFSHFKTCEIFSHTTETEFPIDFAIETLSALKINFDTRFSDFDAIANQIKIFQNPFDADIETLAPELQMEMIDLQCSDIIKNKYENSSLLEFYKSLPLTQFDNLHKFARGLFSVFGTTYLCEKTFSKMKYTKNVYRSKLTNEHLKSLLIIGTNMEEACIVIPIPKKQLSKSLDYFRPISLLPIFGKIFERIILKRLQTYIYTRNVLIPQQFGFRANLSTTHKLITVIDFIQTRKALNEAVGVVLLDLKKAFDMVWHRGLIIKLTSYNFPQKFIRFLKNYLQDISFSVKVGTYISSPRQIESGVPQGSILSPILFNLYINDIPHIPQCRLALFADDTALLPSSRPPDILISRLQNYLEIICNWQIPLQGVVVSTSNKREEIRFNSNCFKLQCEEGDGRK
ncbi:EPM2AIP1, partial [Cordylochernes scorpioides]